MSLTSTEVNYLVYRYLEESGKFITLFLNIFIFFSLSSGSRRRR